MRRKRRGLYLFVLIILIVAILAGGAYTIYVSEAFEQQPPKVQIADKIYWNLKKPLSVKLSDNSGIKKYKVVLEIEGTKKLLDAQKLSSPKKEIELTLKPPTDIESEKSAVLTIEVVDKSLWHYFLGNSTHKRIKIFIDRKRPELYLITNSYSITKGGSALVIFKCSDENLKEFYIKTNFGKKFLAEPFYKDSYYIALIAWPLWQKRFRANVVAIDKANNISRAHIPLYLKNRRYKVSKIKLNDRFLNGKVASLAADYPKTTSMNPLEKFKFVNEKLRALNEKLIHTLSSKVPKDKIDSFPIKPFYPLRNGAAVASFGDHRYYYYQGKLVSESYHLGLDLASIKHALIKSSNNGEVVFANYNGIYGNMPLISHGLGLYTLYGHCSTLFVQKGDGVKRAQKIAKTGMSGLALGDHLHFGVLVQGIEVRPEEWMDKRWIKLNITDVIRDAKKIIDSK